MANTVKATFITTVYNDNKGVILLLDSLLSQTLMPNEIIIVDANSKDTTFETVRGYIPKFPKGVLKIFRHKGNRSKGRNFGIKKSRHGIIVLSDAGCILAKDWFEKITKPFADKTIDVVAGFYKPKAADIFQKSLATYTCVMPNKVTNDFLPSSRSIAFQKNAWKKVGGYPERLNTCEDLVFARNMKKSKLNFYVAKEAVVYWPQRKNILEAFGQFFSYAKGDGEAFYIRWSTPFLFARFVMVIILLLLPINLLLKIFILQILLIMYFGWSVYKNYKYIKNLRALFYLPLLQVISDIAVFFGMTTGIFKRIM